MKRQTRERTAIRQATRDVERIEARQRKKPGGAKFTTFLNRMIKTSTRAPANWTEAKLAAQLTAQGIKGTVKDKAKKGKLRAGGWLIILVIVVPILIIGFLLLNRKVEIPAEGKITDEDFHP